LVAHRGKITKKKSLKERDFVNSALKIQCHIVKKLFFGDFAHLAGWGQCCTGCGCL